MSVLRRLFGADSNGVERAIRTDAAGRLKQSNAQPDIVIGALSAINQTVELDMDGFSSFTVNIGQGSTFAGVTLVLEQTFDNINWTGLLAVRADAASAATITLLANVGTGVYTYTGMAPGAFKVRVRMTGRTSGTVDIRLAASSAATTPVVQTHAVNISGNAAVIPGNTGVTTHILETTASTNAALLVSSNTTVTEFSAFNPTATPAFVKLYNKATAPTVGTDVPVLTIPVPAGAIVNIPFGTMGKRFATGLGWATTANAVKTDTAVAVAGIQLSLSRS